jgi:hypothetical protein
MASALTAPIAVSLFSIAASIGGKPEEAGFLGRQLWNRTPVPGTFTRFAAGTVPLTAARQPFLKFIGR